MVFDLSSLLYIESVAMCVRYWMLDTTRCPRHSSKARDLHRRRNEERFAAETTPVPLLTLFALKALLDLEALNSNNVRGGT